jgi:prevent-host-death family protein
MHTISAAEANRRFSSLLRQVSQGETITVLSHGRPVATISPATAAGESGHDRANARARLLERLNREPAAGERGWSRDELYDRDQ